MRNLSNKISVLFLFINLLLYSDFVAMAQTGSWQVEEGGRIRVSFDFNPRGATREAVYGLIEVELKKGWKTYWKDPGSSGMPPELSVLYSDIDGDELKLTPDLLFPPPSVFSDLKERAAFDERKGEGWIYGYQEKLLLPFRISLPAKSGKIVGYLLIGLCENICQPVQVDFAFDVTEQADVLTKGRIEAAMSALPRPADDNFGVRKITKQGSKLLAHLIVPPGQFLDTKPLYFFIYAPKALVQFRWIKIQQIKDKNNEFTYQFNILSGKVNVGDEIEYIVIGAGIGGRKSDRVSGVQVIEEEVNSVQSKN